MKNTLKSLILVLAFVLGTSVNVWCSNCNTLVVYYSFTGNVQKIVNALQHQTSV